MRIVSTLLFCLGLVACDSGIAYQDRTQGTFSVSQSSNTIEADSDELSISLPIEIGLSRPVVYDSVSTSSVFLIEVIEGSYDLGEQASYLSGLCVSREQVSSGLYLDYPTLTLTPRADLNCSSLYALCLSGDILFEEDLPYTGSTILFATESCR